MQEWRLFLPGEKRLVKAEKGPESAEWSRSWRGREHKAWESAAQERNLRGRSPGRIKKQPASSQRKRGKENFYSTVG